jgi:hypothetical protein
MNHGPTNQKGVTIAELLNYVLYGGMPSLCGKGSIRQGKMSNINSSITVLTPLLKLLAGPDLMIRLSRNGRTNKALRALGHPVHVNI